MKIINNRKIKLLSAGLTALFIVACSQTANKQSTSEQSASEPWQYLLDSQLSQWEKWNGVPHTSVKDLPEGTFTADNLNVGGDPSNAMGLNNDIKNVFSMTEENGEPVLHISGEIYGGLTSKAEFENYHLSLEVKWGEKKWAPRLKAKRDSGLLYHCKGPHGAFWKVWKACQELQIQESDFGDYIPLAGPSGKIRSNSLEGKFAYDPKGEHLRFIDGYADAYIEPDRPHGQWNTVELLVLNDDAIFVVNGQVVMVVEESRDKAGKPLTSGQIQLQSEGAELFYKNVKVKAITSFPENTRVAAGL
ncbi:MAG: 3-keto-disaccharide hydrolase [Thalassotalea sp.]